MLFHRIALPEYVKGTQQPEWLCIMGARVVVPPPPCPVLILLYVVQSGLGNHQNVLTMECMFRTKKGKIGRTTYCLCTVELCIVALTMFSV